MSVNVRMIPSNGSEPASTGRVEAAFERSGYRVLRSIGVEENPRSVHLRGRVKTYYLKQLAQTLALQELNGREFKNELQVG